MLLVNNRCTRNNKVFIKNNNWLCRKFMKTSFQVNSFLLAKFYHAAVYCADNQQIIMSNHVKNYPVL